VAAQVIPRQGTHDAQKRLLLRSSLGTPTFNVLLKFCSALAMARPDASDKPHCRQSHNPLQAGLQARERPF